MTKKSTVRAFSSNQETEENVKRIKKRGLNISRTIRCLINQFSKNGFDFNSISAEFGKTFVQIDVDDETLGYVRYAKDMKAVDMNSAFKKFMKKFADDNYQFKTESEES